MKDILVKLVLFLLWPLLAILLLLAAFLFCFLGWILIIPAKVTWEKGVPSLKYSFSRKEQDERPEKI